MCKPRAAAIYAVWPEKPFWPSAAASFPQPARWETHQKVHLISRRLVAAWVVFYIRQGMQMKVYLRFWCKCWCAFAAVIKYFPKASHLCVCIPCTSCVIALLKAKEINFIKVKIQGLFMHLITTRYKLFLDWIIFICSTFV